MSELVERIVPVAGSNPRWAMSNLRAQGVPIEGWGRDSSGDFVIIVLLPADAPLPNYRYAPAARRAPFRFDTRSWLRWAAVLAVVAVLAGVLWFMFSPSDQVTAETGGMRLDPVTGHGIPDEGMWGWLSDIPALHLSWPWADTQSQPAQPRGDGWQWPWDAAVQSAQDTVTLAAGALLAALVLLIILALVRRKGQP